MTPHFALFDMITWWAHLTNAQQFFYGVGIVAGIVTLIMAVLGLFGLGHHDADVTGGSVDGDHMDGSSLFSTKPLTGFFLAFGWVGGIALEAGASLAKATLLAFASGTALMFVLAWLIRTIYSMRSDGTRQINDAIGKVGTVYVTLPPSRAAGGQINVTVSGRLETLPALNAALRSIPSGEKVKVVGVIDTNTVLVEPMA
jgi:membrane protein implicated in regulation of membrane protease activity